MEKTRETSKTPIKRYYFVDSEGNTRRCNLPNEEEIKKDKVVDYTSFRPDNEEERIFRLTGQGGNGIIGKYDKEGAGPSDLVVKIRQGKLDKAEVQQALKAKTEEFKETQAEEAKKEKEAIAEARQDFLDKATGFEGKPKES